MQNLKFRAFDGEKLRYDVTGFEHGQNNEMRGVFLDGDFYLIVEEFDETNHYKRQAIVDQYTGLKDANGVEIYEGDIIKFLDAEDTSTENGYDFSEFMNIGVVCYGTELLRYEVSNCESVDMETLWQDDVEVIGNIHENPDLVGE